MSTAAGIEQFLRQFSHSQEEASLSFTLHAARAERYAGYLPLRLCDVPLLLLAAAVEGRSSYFRVHGRQSCRLTWDGPAGPCLEQALAVLRLEKVDYSMQGRQSLILPDLFRELLGSLFARSSHAPLSLVVGDRVLRTFCSGNGVRAIRSRDARLTLVDRGVDFDMPFAFPGLQVVAGVAPLSGASWPRSLLWNEKLNQEVTRIAEHLL